MKLKIRTKVLGSFAIITTLIILVSLFGISGLRNINTEYKGVIETNIPLATSILELRAIRLEQDAALQGFLTYGDEKYSKSFEMLNETIVNIQKEIENVVQDEKSKEYLERLNRLHIIYLENGRKAVDYHKQDQRIKALQSAEEGTTQGDEIKALINEWLDLVNSDNKGIVDNVHRLMGRTVLISFIIVGISIIFSFILALYLTSRISSPVTVLTRYVNLIASGDLTKPVPRVKTGDEIEDLTKSFAVMAANLRSIIIKVSDASKEMVSSTQGISASSEDISKVSEQIAQTISDLAIGANEQASSTEKGNEKIKEVIFGIEGIAEEMRKSQELVTRSKNMITVGQHSMQLQEEKMNENKQVTLSVSASIQDLVEKSQQIEQILKVIRGIAEQTNLLALNAAIEAARAGENGRGFAVVSEEIRKLAEQSNTSVKKIDAIIKEVQNSVQLSVNEIGAMAKALKKQESVMDDTVKAFQNIFTFIEEITGNIQFVNASANILNSNAISAGYEIASVASVAEQTAASTEQVSASTQEQTTVIGQVAESAEKLAKIAGELEESITKFKIL